MRQLYKAISFRTVIICILTSVLCILNPANAMMTVWNPSSYMQMAQMITNATKTINEMKALKDQMDQMKKLIGNPQALRQAINLGFLDRKGDPITTLNRINLFTSQTAQLTDVQSVRSYAQSRLFLPNPDYLTADLQQTVRKERQHVVQEASLNSLALAEQQKHSLPQAIKEAHSIGQQAASATTVIEAIHQTNQLLNLIAAEVRELRMLQAQQLELHSAVITDSQPVSFQRAGIVKDTGSSGRK